MEIKNKEELEKLITEVCTKWLREKFLSRIRELGDEIRHTGQAAGVGTGVGNILSPAVQQVLAPKNKEIEQLRYFLDLFK